MGGKSFAYRIIPNDEFLALINANAPSAANPFATIADVIAGSTYITVVTNYSALPAPNTVTGQFYWVENSQGTAWLPGSLGGTYYPKGLYYSNGVSWIVTDAPYQASQAEVGTEVGDGGIENTKFVTAETLYGKSYSRYEVLSNEAIPAHRAVVIPVSTAVKFDPSDPTHYGKVIGISYNSVGIGGISQIVSDDKITIGIGLFPDGSRLFATTNGVLTNIAPTTGIVQPVGVYTNGVLDVHIGTPILKI